MIGAQPLAAGAGAQYNITIAPHQDFIGMKISNDIDIERLLNRVRKETAYTVLETAKREIGQGRN
jgi:hypothetical protein